MVNAEQSQSGSWKIYFRSVREAIAYAACDHSAVLQNREEHIPADFSER